MWTLLARPQLAWWVQARTASTLVPRRRASAIAHLSAATEPSEPSTPTTTRPATGGAAAGSASAAGPVMSVMIRVSPAGGGLGRPPSGPAQYGGGEPVGRHVAVDGLDVARVHAVGLVPDADVTGVADAPVERPPWLEVRVVTVAGEALQVGERPPVLDHDRRRQEGLVVGQQPLLRVLLEVAQHPRHRGEDRPPPGHLPRPVDAHPDEEDDHLALDSVQGGGVSSGADPCHDHSLERLLRPRIPPPPDAVQSLASGGPAGPRGHEQRCAHPAARLGRGAAQAGLQ